MTSPLDETTSLDLSHYLTVLRRRAGVVVVGVLLGLVAAVLYLVLADRAVTASTLVNVNVISSDPFSTPRSASGLIDASTETQTASSSVVLNQVASGLGETPSTIRRNMTATLASGNTVMRITYTADSTTAAEDGADAIAQAYLDFRSAQADARVQRIVDQLNAQRDGLRDDLVRINTILKRAKAGSGRAIQAESDRQLTNIELNSLSSQINTFLGLDATGGVVLTTAAESPTSVSPSKTLILSTGLGLGLILGVLAAFAINSTDRRIRDARSLQRAGGGEVLGELTSSRPGIPAASDDLDVVRTVRELLFATMPDDPPVVAVADLSTGASVPDVAANLALTAVETGRSVHLVMADADKDAVDLAVRSLGLTPVRSEDGTRRFTSTAHGAALTVSAPARGTLSQMDTAGGAEGIDGGSAMTVIAVPQGAARASLLAAGRLGHAVVLVVSKGGTTAATVNQAAKELAVVGATVNGSVLVPRKRKLAQGDRA